MTIISFILFLAFAGVLTWLIVRKQDVGSNTGFFLAGRSLTFPLIAASLLLTNLSTEQMVGLNGSAFREGLCVMAWEVVAVVSLVAMAWFFLPKFLKSGVTTVPEYLELRYGKSTGVLANAIFLFFYVFLLLPLILYTGATCLARILDFESLLGIQDKTTVLWIAIWMIGLMGCAYSLFGGLRTCAVLDTINGIGLLIGGFMIVFFALNKVSEINGGGHSIMESLSMVKNANAEMFNTYGRPKSEVPFLTLFTGVLIINMFYWCTNQQIIQRTFGAKGLAEGQKGVLLCGLLKLLGPLYLVLPGMIAFYFACKGKLNIDMNSSALAYGELVRFVLPNWLAGFFAAVLVGAVLSSFNGVLNSSCTLFSIGFYKGLINPQAEDKKVVLSGRIFGLVIAIFCMCGAPLLAKIPSIFDYLQKTNGIYNIPLFAIIVVGMLTKFVPKKAANVALFVGVVLIAFLTFGDKELVKKVTFDQHIYHVDTVVFFILVAIMGIWSLVAPRKEAFVQEDVKAVDMTPWKLSWVAGALLFIIVGIIYVKFGDFKAVNEKNFNPVPEHWMTIAHNISETDMNALGFTKEQQEIVNADIDHMIKFLAADKDDQKKVFAMVTDYRAGKTDAAALVNWFNDVKEAPAKSAETTDKPAATSDNAASAPAANDNGETAPAPSAEPPATPDGPAPAATPAKENAEPEKPAEAAAKASVPGEIVYQLVSEYQEKDKDGNVKFSINGDTELTHEVVLRIIAAKYAEINGVPAEQLDAVNGLIVKLYADFKLPEEQKKALKDDAALKDLKEKIKKSGDGSILAILFQTVAPKDPNTVEEVIQNVQDAANQAAQNVQDQIQQAAQDAQAQVQQTAQNAQAQVQQTAQNAQGQIQQAAQNAQDSLRNGLNNALNNQNR